MPHYWHTEMLPQGEPFHACCTCNMETEPRSRCEDRCLCSAYRLGNLTMALIKYLGTSWAVLQPGTSSAR
jgi:hypothetical protein